MTSQRNQPILVTGTSSGIGLHLTQRLAGMGHTVYATARNAGDLDRLEQIENVIPIQ
jgi:NAD(P)-dependent dehydrogenase (short-subunit alcohol dehydrogenase family)